jgi:hypothetical protein
MPLYDSSVLLLRSSIIKFHALLICMPVPDIGLMRSAMKPVISPRISSWRIVVITANMTVFSVAELDVISFA